MHRIQPFRGLLYNSNAVGNLSNVVAPPYDVISPEEHETLYKKHANNIVRLILNKEEAGDNAQHNKYTRAASLLKEWRASGVFLQDANPAFYYYVQNYSIPTGEKFQREGFLGLLELSDFKEKRILPHEETHAKPRKDRMRLILTSRTHLSSIFLLYEDPHTTIENSVKNVLSGKPYLNVKDKDGVWHRAWKISDPVLVKKIQRICQNKKFLIADGHHRYNASLEAMKHIRKKQKRHAPHGQSYDYTLAYFCCMHNPGLTILPTHRMIYGVAHFSKEELLDQLGKYFIINDIAIRKNHLNQALKKAREEMLTQSSHALSSFGLYFPQEEKIYILKGKSRILQNILRKKQIPKEFFGLDVVILHRIIIEDLFGISPKAQEQQKNIHYIKGILELPPLLKKNDYQAFFLMNPISLKALRSVVKTGLCLPQKTTYFYPKLLSGIVLHPFD